MLNRRNFLKASASALGLTAAGPLAGRARAGDWYPWGIDVSHWQGTINWNAVAAAGVTFCFMKATEGTTFIDNQFSRNWAEAARVGIWRGAYHFARPSSSPTIARSASDQADFHVSVVNPQAGDLFCVLDTETRGTLTTAAQLRTWIQAYANRMAELTGYPPFIYTSPGFWRYTVGNPSDNYGCPLWVAHWNVSWPTVPIAWSDVGWTFWQYSSTGSCPGISGRVDQDTFNGPASDLWWWTYQY